MGNSSFFILSLAIIVTSCYNKICRLVTIIEVSIMIDDLIKRFSNTTENQEKAIFSTLFIAGNKLQTLFDKRIPEICYYL